MGHTKGRTRARRCRCASRRLMYVPPGAPLLSPSLFASLSASHTAHAWGAIVSVCGAALRERCAQHAPSSSELSPSAAPPRLRAPRPPAATPRRRPPRPPRDGPRRPPRMVERRRRTLRLSFLHSGQKRALGPRHEAWYA